MPFKSIADIDRRYDCVVIGSGLGGLTAGNQLAKAGHKVLILEHHYQLGGLATWFTRRHGHIFDISLHGFPYGMIKTCRKYWTKEIKDGIVQLKDIRFYNPQFDVQTTFDRDDFTNILIEKFGIEPAKVDSFFEHVFGMNFYDNDRQTTGEMFEQFFPGRNDVHRFLLEPITYANGSTLEDLAITYGIVFSNFMNKGVYIYRGGTDKMIRLMAEEIEANDGTICSRTEVKKIEIDNGKVRGVHVTNRKETAFIEAPCVVSNAGLKNTIFNLAGADHFPDEWTKDAEQVRLNHSSCQVYMGVKKGQGFEPKGDLVFTSKADTFNTDELFDFKTTSKTFSIYYPDTRFDNPKYDKHYAIVASLNARFADWDSLSDADYKAAKDKLAEQTVKDLNDYIPGIAENIDWVEVGTPKTVERYTLHQGGSSFGTKFEGLDVSRNIFKHVGGLFHSGSVGIIMSGWLGTINYGVIVANDADAYLTDVKHGTPTGSMGASNV